MITFELDICEPFSTIICHKVISRVTHGCPNVVPEFLLLSNIFMDRPTYIYRSYL